MKDYKVVFTPEAVEQLTQLFDYLMTVASIQTASSYTKAIALCCESIGKLPHECTRRDDIRSGLRMTNYKGNTVIAFVVDDPARTITVAGFF